jgi:hypothetical protein
MDRIKSYVNEVLSYIIADNRMKKRIRDDLLSQLNEAANTEDIDSVIGRMGDPKDVAREFMDSIYDDKSEIFEEIMSDRSDNAMFIKRIYEYKSKRTVFGIPLVHIKISRYGRPSVAKGIIAIGTISIGIISIGAIPIGVISLGGLALGLVTFGGASIGLLLALGGFAAGAVAIGGITLGLGAIGGIAIGKIAIGGVAKGTVAIGDEVFGDYVLKINHLGPETSAEAAAVIRSAFPGLPDWIIDLISGISANVKGY